MSEKQCLITTQHVVLNNTWESQTTDSESIKESFSSYSEAGPKHLFL